MLQLGMTMPIKPAQQTLPSRYVCNRGPSRARSLNISLESLSGRWAHLVDILAIRTPELVALFTQRGDQRVLLAAGCHRYQRECQRCAARRLWRL